MSKGDSQSEAVLSQNIKIWYFLSLLATRLYVAYVLQAEKMKDLRTEPITQFIQPW